MPHYVAVVNLGIAPWGPRYPKGAEVPADHPALQELLAEGLVVKKEEGALPETGAKEAPSTSPFESTDSSDEQGTGGTSRRGRKKWTTQPSPTS